jgi:hypothetical protein
VELVEDVVVVSDVVVVVSNLVVELATKINFFVVINEQK